MDGVGWLVEVCNVDVESIGPVNEPVWRGRDFAHVFIMLPLA